MSIELKTPDEIEIMAKAAKLVAETLQALKKEIRPGITTGELDRLAEEFIRSRGGGPAFKGYRNYPNTLCASVDEQVVCGIASTRALRPGVVLGLDLAG